MSNKVSLSSNKVVKAGAGYVIGNYLLKGITFLSAPIFTRLLTTAEYGDFNTYLSYESIIYILVGIALHSSINNAKYKYGDALNSYVSSIVTLLLTSTGIWFVISNIFFDFYKSIFGFDRIVANILIFHCLCSSLLQIYNVYVSLTYSVKSFLKVTAFNGVANIVVSVLLLLTVFNNQRCFGRIVGTVIPIGLIGIYILVFFFKNAKPSINLSYWKFGLLYSLPIVPHGISQVVLSTFDRIMIKSMVGSSEAGIYSFSYVVYSLFRVATTSLENVWKPWVYEKMDAKDYDTVRKQGTKYAFGMAIFTVLIMFASPEIVKILGDKEYWNSTPCVIPVLVGGFFAFLYTLPSLIEYFYCKTQFIALGTMCAAGLNILLNYICIPRYGYIAAAYTTLVTYIAYFLFHYILAAKIHGKSIYSTRDIFLIAFSVLILAVVAIEVEPLWAIRWTLIIAISAFAVIWANKEFDIVNKIGEKIRK